MKKKIFIKKNKIMLIFTISILALILGLGSNYLFSNKAFKNEYKGQISRYNASSNELRYVWYFDKNGGTGGSNSYTFLVNKEKKREYATGTFCTELLSTFIDEKPTSSYRDPIELPTREGYEFWGYKVVNSHNEVEVAFGRESLSVGDDSLHPGIVSTMPGIAAPDGSYQTESVTYAYLGLTEADMNLNFKEDTLKAVWSTTINFDKQGGTDGSDRAIRSEKTELKGVVIQEEDIYTWVGRYLR